jgi:hypothetical protein
MSSAHSNYGAAKGPIGKSWASLRERRGIRHNSSNVEAAHRHQLPVNPVKVIR